MGKLCPESKPKGMSYQHDTVRGFFWHKPDLTMCCELGEMVMVHIPEQEHRKLDACAVPCRLLGVDNTSKAWQVWNEHAHKICVSCECIFPADYSAAPTEEICEDSQDKGEWESITTPAYPSAINVSPPKPNSEPMPIITGEPAQAPMLGKKKPC